MASTAETLAMNKKFDSRPEDDHPPDSFWLAKDAELDWLDRNAFLERNYSTKGNSLVQNSASSLPHKAAAALQLRKSDASIIWIPNTQRRSSFPETKLRRAPPPIRLFPRRTDVIAVGKAAAEPSSPKVSCTGRVRQQKKKEKVNTSGRKKHNKKTLSMSVTPRTESDRRVMSSSGLWMRLRDVFRSGKLKDSANDVVAPQERWMMKTSMSIRAHHSSIVEPVPTSLNRFASGRKSDSWVADLKNAIDEVESLRSEKNVGLWSRRNFAAPKELECSRDWLDSGPASV